MRPQVNLDRRHARALDPRVSFSRASDATFQMASGVWRRAAAGGARLGHASNGTALGLVLETEAVNRVRNPLSEVVTTGTIGSGGVLPTNWSWSPISGMALEIVGVVVVDGVDCLRVRVSGTAGASGSCFLFCETALGIAASNGQAWTQSALLRRHAAPGTAPVVQMRPISRNSGGAQLTAFAGSSLTLSAPLTRFSSTVTIADATAAAIQPAFAFPVTISTAYDATFDIGWPQMELGALASSPIIPPVGSPAATTRPADAMSALVTDFGATAGLLAGTLVINGRTPAADATAVALTFDDGTADNRIALSRQAGRAMRAAVVIGGSMVATLDGPTVADSTDFVLAVGFEAGTLALCCNGGTVVTAAPASIPPGLVRLAASGWGGSLARVGWWPRRLSATDLQSVTA